MYDYASVHLVGRATDDAILNNVDSDEYSSIAIFTLAMNLPVRKDDEVETYTIFRRILAIGPFARYIAKIQESDTLKGRLIDVVGIMDDDFKTKKEIVRVAPPLGYLKIMDRRVKD